MIVCPVLYAISTQSGSVAKKYIAHPASPPLFKRRVPHEQEDHDEDEVGDLRPGGLDGVQNDAQLPGDKRAVVQEYPWALARFKERSASCTLQSLCLQVSLCEELLFVRKSQEF